MRRFHEDLQHIADLGEDKFDKLLRFLGENQLLNGHDFRAYELFCDKNEIPAEEGEIIRDLMVFILIRISGFHKKDKSLEEFEKEFVSDYLGDKKVKTSWERVKSAFKSKDIDKIVVNVKRKMLRTTLPRIDLFNVVCDIRPIFNYERSRIADFDCPVIISIEDDSGSNKKMVFEVDEQLLIYIKDEIDSALEKINLCRGMIGKWK